MVIALIYVLPLVVMLLAYSVIGLTLWRREVPRHQMHGASLRHLRAKRKVGAGSRLGGGGALRAPPRGTALPGSKPAVGDRTPPNLPLSQVPGQSLSSFFPGRQTCLWPLAFGQMRS